MSLPRPAVVLFVTDVATVAAFYEGVAALARTHADDDHVVLHGAGLELVVHRLRGEPPPVRDAAGRVIVREDSYLKPSFPVPDLAAARTHAAELGGALQGPEREWAARDVRAVDGHDPEGNVFQLRTSA